MIELLVLAIAPSLFLAWYFYMRDRYEREPKILLLLTYSLGILAVLPAFIIEVLGSMIIPIRDELTLFLNVFFIVALTEEFLKFGAVRIAAYRSKEFNEVMDGIVYCVIAALGFATLENVLYAFRYGLLTTLLRDVLSVPSHALWGGLMGYFIGLAKTYGKEETNVFKGLLIAVLLHGIYDFIAFSFNAVTSLLIIAPLIVFSWTVLLWLMKKADALSPFRRWGPPTPKLARSCSKCGGPLTYIPQYNRWYCYRCGAYA